MGGLAQLHRPTDILLKLERRDVFQPQSQLYEDFLPAVLFIAPSSFHFSLAGSRQLSADTLGQL